MNMAIPYVNILLLVAAVTLFAGACLITAGFLFYKDDPDHKKLPVADRHLKKNEYGKYHTAIHCIPGT
jgi:Flp pilus assembly protein protease CpaA